jgi:alkanesulfonate monooxygenase SsuD/methylene tetrahydromethanopterin reductase-like flavin-dependent oxidoreductase (luciferase family)
MAMTDGLDFGIFDWIDHNEGLSLGETYEQRLRMLECADEAGFWCYHLAEHHGTPLAVAPTPNLFLSAAAQRTQHLRLGPLVQLLPLYNPLRNIEDVCFLDHISNGRLELGVGRGVSAEELGIYGVDIAESRQRFEECFDILLMGLSKGEVTYEGRYYQLHEAPVTVSPLQQPYPPLWYPSSSPDRIAWVAEHGFNTLFGFTRTGLEDIANGVAVYRRTFAEHANDPARLNAHVATPKLGATRHVFVADTDEEAQAIARPAYNNFDRSFLTRPGNTRAGESRRGDFDTALSWGGIYAGSPETVRKQVQHFVDATGANYFVGTFAFGNLTTDQILRSVQLFAKEVMPAVTPARAVAG